jgi:hypothetical protein
MSQTLDNLKNLAKGTVKLAIINGNTRNAQMQKLISLALESFESITAIGAKVVRYEIKENPLKSNIDLLSADLAALITNMGKVLKEADAKLIPTTSGDDLTSKSTPSGDETSHESLEEAKLELQSLLASNQAEKEQLARDREYYQKELKSLKDEKRAFQQEQSAFIDTKAHWVDNTNQRESSSSSDNMDSNASTSSRSSRSSRNSRTGKSKSTRDGKSYKLPTSIPKFDGRQDLEKWLFIVDTQLKILSVPRKLKLDVVSPHFAGLALEYLIKFRKVDRKKSWSKFKKELRRVFATHDRENKIRKEIMSIKHYGNFTSFIRKFLSLLNQAPDDYNENERIFFFTNALSMEAQHDLKRAKPRTLTEAIEIATLFDEMHPVNRQANHVNATNGTTNPTKKKKNRNNNQVANNVNHNSNSNNNRSNNNNSNNRRSNGRNYSNRQTNGRQPNSNRSNINNSSNNTNNNNSNGNKSNTAITRVNKDYSGYQCYKCKAYGHIARDCTSRVNAVTNQQLAISWDNSSSEENRAQSNDNQIRNQPTVSSVRFSPSQSFQSHRLNVLTIYNSESFGQLVMVPAYIYGRKVFALLDTGASVCLISKRVADNLNLNIETDDSKVVMASNETTRSLGIARNVSIKICSFVCKLDFIILDCVYDVIIGTPWFTKSCAGLKWRADGSRTLKFDRMDYDLDGLQSINSFQHLMAGVEAVNDKAIGDDVGLVESVDEAMEGLLEENWSFSESDIKIKVASPLATDQRRRFEDEIIPIVDRLVARSLKDLNGCKLPPAKIIVEGEPMPVRQYRRSEKQKEIESVAVKELLDAGIIEPSNSKYFQNIFINSKGRICLDSRPVNSVTPKRSWPVPIIDDILAKVSRFRYSTKFDFTRGFWQQPLHQDSRQYAAFICTLGVFQFTRMAFGLRNALFEFQRAMDSLFNDLPFVVSYVDDIVCVSETFDEHIRHLKIVLKRIKDAGLKLNGEKTVFAFCIVDVYISLRSFQEQ